MKTRFAIHQVLYRIVRTIAHEGLWVNCQPGLPLSTKNIASMEIGSQEYISRRGSRQFFHDAQTLIYQSCIRPEVSLRDSLFAPEIDHL